MSKIEFDSNKIYLNQPMMYLYKKKIILVKQIFASSYINYSNKHFSK